MNNTGGSINFDITANNDDLKRKLAESRQALLDSGRTAEEQGSKIESMFKRAAMGAGVFFSAQQALQFAKHIAVVRGEFQQLEVAFTTMLGSATKGKAMMRESVELAAKTPFDLKGVAQGAKQLLAYGSDAKVVTQELTMLGNIAAGLSIPLGDMVYLYGTTQTQGRLYTQDMRQFMGRGIPLAEELAKQIGVTKDKISEMVTAGKIGFPEVQKALQSMTSEGGKFNNLMEMQSKTITGQISNLGDAIDVTFNKMGQSQEGFISSSIGMATSLVENYEKVGKVIGTLIGLYGTYKAAVIVLSTIEQARVKATISGEVALSIATRQATTLNALRYVATLKLKAAQDMLNKAMAKNPYVLVGMAVATLVVGMYKLITYQTAAEKAQEKLNDAFNRFTSETAVEQVEIDRLFGKLDAAKKGTKEYDQAKQAIVDKYGTYLNGLSEEIRSLNNVAAAYEAISMAAKQAAIDRAISDAKTEAMDTFKDSNSEHLDDLRKAIDDKIDNDRDAAALYQRIVQELNKEGKLSAETQKIVDKFTKSEMSGSSITGGASTSITNIIQSNINAIKADGKTLKDALSAVDTKFGQQGDNYLSMTSKQIEGQVSELKKHIKALNGKEGTIALQLDLSKAESALKTIKDKEAHKDETNAARKIRYTKELTEAEKKLREVTAAASTSSEKEQADAKAEVDRLKELLGLKKQSEKPTDGGDPSKLDRAILDSQLKLEAERLAIMEDGRVKRLAQSELEWKEKKLALQREYDETKVEYAKQKKALPTEITTTLTSRMETEDKAKAIRDTVINTDADKDIAEHQRALTEVYMTEENKRLAAIKERYDKEREWVAVQVKNGGMTKEQGAKYGEDLNKNQQYEELDFLLKKYHSYTEERKAIEAQFQAEIATLQTKNAGGKYDAQIKAAQDKQKEALSKADFEEIKKGVDFTQLFGDLDALTLPSLQSLRDKIKAWIDGAGKSLSPNDFKAVSDAFQKLDLKIADVGPFQALKNAMGDLRVANKNLKEAQTEYDAINADGTKALEEKKIAEEKLTAAQNARCASLAEATKSINAIGQKGQQVVGAANDVAGILSDLGVGIPESVKGVIDGVGQTMDGLASIDLTKPLSIITGLTKAVGGLFKSISSIFTHDARKERDIKRLQKQVDALDVSYKKLGEAVEYAYSIDASKMIGQQDKMLAQQKVLIQNQIAEEESKKDSDNGRIEAWRDQIDQINETLSDNKIKAQDAIFGADVKSAIDDFASAYADAWAAGEDRAKAMKDVVKNMIKGVIVEMLKSDLAPTVKKIREQVESMLTDNIIDDFEQTRLDQIIEAATSAADNKYGWADKYLKGDDSDRQAAAKGMAASMTQDSADELNGQFRMWGSILFDVRGNQLQMLELQRAQLPNLHHLTQLTLLPVIAENTAYCRKLEGIEQDMGQMRRAIETIRDKGITIKK